MHTYTGMRLHVLLRPVEALSLVITSDRESVQISWMVFIYRSCLLSDLA